MPGALPLSNDSDISGRIRTPRATPRTVIALSEDSQLLEALEGVPGTVAAVVLSTSVERFADQLVAEACGVALVDAASIVDPIDFIAGLRRQFPELILVVAGGGHLQAPLTALLADGTVFRFVHKPASAQRLQLFIEAALRRHEEATEQETSRRLAALRLPPTRSAARPHWWVLAALLALAAMAALIAISRRRPHAAPHAVGASAIPTPSVPSSVDPGPVGATDPVLAQMLTNAESALAQNRLVAADGSGAGDLYHTALQRAPGNARALQGLSRVTVALLDGAERAMAATQNDDAARLVADVLRLQPDNVRAAALSVQLSQQRETQLREQLRRTTSGAKAEQAQVYLQLARRRMDSGALLEPSDDSASSYLEAARALAPDDAAVRALSSELNRRLADRQSAKVMTSETARPEIAAPVSVPAPPPAPAPAPAQVPASVQAAVSPAAVSAAAPVPAAPSGASAGASAGSAGPADSVAASSLQRDHFVPPLYPPAALARGLSGWVDLEFTVAPTGAVKDAVITDAQPRRTFDEAALAAVRQWHFRPVLRNGVPVEQRAHVRMRFSL